MEITLIVKTGKGKKSSAKDVDKTVDELMKIAEYMGKKGYNLDGGRCFCDGTQAVLKK